ncbi:response regulator [Streptomyces bottropensis]|uniref:response regulator n=1 Tax=Streptomyces bottropensis TaxID=42235 RepID=UPI0037F8E336
MRQTASFAPDVLLMDLQMPGMDGTTATAAIRAAHPEVQVLVLTTRHGRADITAAIDVGAVGYLLGLTTLSVTTDYVTDPSFHRSLFGLGVLFVGKGPPYAQFGDLDFVRAVVVRGPGQGPGQGDEVQVPAVRGRLPQLAVGRCHVG